MERKTKLTIELEPGDYVVSVHPARTWAWKHEGNGVFTGHGGKIRRVAIADAIRELSSAAERHYGVDTPLVKFHESRGIEDLADLFTLQRGDKALRCALRTRPGGWLLRFISGGGDEQTQQFDTENESEMLAAAMKWKDEKVAEGWSITASRVRIRHGYHDVAWNLIPVTSPRE